MGGGSSGGVGELVKRLDFVSRLDLFHVGQVFGIEELRATNDR